MHLSDPDLENEHVKNALGTATGSSCKHLTNTLTKTGRK
jgi:hypothetical protein